MLETGFFLFLNFICVIKVDLYSFHFVTHSRIDQNHGLKKHMYMCVMSFFGDHRLKYRNTIPIRDKYSYFALSFALNKVKNLWLCIFKRAECIYLFHILLNFCELYSIENATWNWKLKLFHKYVKGKVFRSIPDNVLKNYSIVKFSGIFSRTCSSHVHCCK